MGQRKQQGDTRGLSRPTDPLVPSQKDPERRASTGRPKTQTGGHQQDDLRPRKEGINKDDLRPRKEGINKDDLRPRKEGIKWSLQVNPTLALCTLVFLLS